MSVLVVAPWGCPAQWKVATYVLDRVREGTCTSLVPLVKKLKESGEEVTVVVIVLDSLVDEYVGKRVESPCYRHYVSCFRRIIGGKCGISDYGEVVGYCRELARCVAENVARERDVVINDLRVVVSPCIGSPGGRWCFVGNARDFMSVTLYELGKLCLLEGRYDRVVLDLTHGVNFMPSTCLHIMYYLVSILLVRYDIRDGVLLEVYNSDPYPPERARLEPEVSLNINLVLKERVKAVEVPHTLPAHLLRPRDRVPEYVAERVKELNKKFVRPVRIILSTIYYPLPLALLKAVRECDVEGVVDALKEAVSLWREQVRVISKGSGKTEVSRPVELNPLAVYAGLLTHAVYLRLAEAGRNCEGVGLKDLEDLAELYRVVNESYYYLIMDEAGRIKKSLKNYKWETNCVKLADLLGQEGGSTSPNKRVMIAHAGLQKELVLLCGDERIDYEYSTLGIGSIEELLKKAGLLLRRG